jgi:membrane protease YdiL (CAAX protease family)
MTKIDAAYLALIATGLWIDARILWPSFLRRSGTDAARARIWLWSTTILFLWTLAGAGVAIWIVERRSWAALRFVAPHGWRAFATIFLLLAVVVFYIQPVTKIARARRSNKRIKFPNDAARRSPHSRLDLAWWMALSVSAGFCEEFLFRGYLIWVLEPTLGLWVAAAVSLVVFTIAHAYQGTKGMVAVAAVGGLFTLIVLVLGSLVSAIGVHMLIDAGEGIVAWLALRGIPVENSEASGLADRTASAPITTSSAR